MFKSFFHNLITSGFSLGETDIELKKVRLINFILLLAIPVNTLFILGNYSQGLILFAVFNIIIVIVMLTSFFYLRMSEKNIKFAAHGTILGMFISHLAALLQGGIENTGFLWFFLFPLFSLFLTGRKAGKLWLLALFSAIAIVFILQDHLDLPYAPIYLIFLVVALFLESAYVLFSQKIQLRYESELAQINRKLKDLTFDLKESNQELQHLTQNLQEEVDAQVSKARVQDTILSQQAKMASVGEMLSFISHQWKQPITTIDVIVQNIQLSKALEADDLDEVTANGLNEVLVQTNLMISTMNEFLQFSRPSDNNNFSVKHALTMLQQLIATNFTNSNVDLTFEQEDQTLMLYGKENGFVHALMNIANNAKDIFVQKKINTGKVLICVTQNDNNIIMTLTDNAGGIPDEIIDSIFKAYFSTKLDKGGTGLGLHMSHKIIHESMNGSLKVINKDEGACFTATLPKAKVD